MTGGNKRYHVPNKQLLEKRIKVDSSIALDVIKIDPSNCDTSCQTDPVLLFGSKMELFDFVRMSRLLMDQVSRAVQATPVQASLACQADSCLKIACTQTNEVKSGNCSTATQRLEFDSSLLPLQSVSWDAATRAHVISAGNCLNTSASPQIQRVMESYISKIANKLPLLSADVAVSSSQAVVSSIRTQQQQPTPVNAVATDSNEFHEESTSEDQDNESVASDILYQIRCSGLQVKSNASPCLMGRRRGSGRYAATGARSRIRPHILRCHAGLKVVPLRTFNDVRSTDPDEEFRVDRSLCEQLQKSCCSQGNFGWRLITMLYHPDDLKDCNYLGNRGKRPLSPRRLHAIEHAYHDYFPEEQISVALAEARCAINQGLRNLAHASSTTGAASTDSKNADVTNKIKEEDYEVANLIKEEYSSASPSNSLKSFGGDNVSSHEWLVN